jgi:hypothetical protein
MTRSHSRSRSRSPCREEREERRRSRSPRRRRDEERPKRIDRGFKWKEKRRDDEEQNGDDSKRLDRGYRDRRRSRSPRRDREADKAKEDVERAGVELAKKEKKDKKEKKEKKASALAASNEPMIIVNVNDRLGTKAAIPCLASDPISLCLSLLSYSWLTKPCYRTLQSSSRSENRSPAARDPSETSRRKTIQRPAYAGGLRG